MNNFRDLLVWQKAYDLSLRVEALSERIAPSRKRLATQLEEASASIPAGIAEGAGRGSSGDFAHFLAMAIGSTNEVENHLQRAFDRRLISREEHDTLTHATVEVRKMLIGLRKAVLGKPRPKDDSR